LLLESVINKGVSMPSIVVQVQEVIIAAIDITEGLGYLRSDLEEGKVLIYFVDYPSSPKFRCKVISYKLDADGYPVQLVVDLTLSTVVFGKDLLVVPMIWMRNEDRFKGYADNGYINGHLNYRPTEHVVDTSSDWYQEVMKQGHG
jgi:hypothetical protein